MYIQFRANGVTFLEHFEKFLGFLFLYFWKKENSLKDPWGPRPRQWWCSLQNIFKVTVKLTFDLFKIKTSLMLIHI